MAPVIRIADDLYRKLESMAIGFGSPQNVIERLVDEREEKSLSEFVVGDVNKVIPQTKEFSTNKNERRRITPEMIEQAYICAKDVFERKITKDDALDILVKDANMKEVTAVIHIYVFLQIMQGEIYKRAINAQATKYFLEHIRDDYGEEALKKALSALWQHIEYKESLSGSGRHYKMREIHEEFSQKF